MWFLCVKRCNILVSDDTIGKEDRIGDSRDTSKEGDHGKKGSEPRISQ